MVICATVICCQTSFVIIPFLSLTVSGCGLSAVVCPSVRKTLRMRSDELHLPLHATLYIAIELWLLSAPMLVDRMAAYYGLAWAFVGGVFGQMLYCFLDEFVVVDPL